MSVSDILFNTILILFKGNRDFFNLIDDFHQKLPPKSKKAKEGVPIIPFGSTINLTPMKMNLNVAEIDSFHKQLENFSYDRIIFKKKGIIQFSKNLQRLLNTNNWDKFTIAIIQSLLEDEDRKKRIPYLFGYRIGRVIGF